MPVQIDPDRKVAELLALHPKVLETLIACGFTPLKFPGVRAAMAHTITLRQACEKRKVDLEQVIARIQAACQENP
jgi:hypothetical protein